MSNTNGQVSFVKSMNGILSFNTGSGTTIEGDSITTDIINCDTLNTTNFNATNLNTDNIQGTTPSSNITLYTNSTGDIHIGSANSLNYVDGPLYVDNIFGTTTGTAFIYPNVVADINIGSSIIPITGNYVCTASNHLANKGYVDSKVGVNLIPLANVWTGTSNTFNNKIIVNTIDALNVGDTVSLYGNLSTGTINIGVNATSAGAINIGNASATGSFSVSEGTININPKTTLNMANQIGTGTSNICNANTYQGTLNIAATANTNSALLNALNIGSATSNITIKARTITIDSNNDIDILKPLSPGYSVFANVGTSVINTVGYIIQGSITIGNGVNLPDNGNNEYGNITNLPIGVYIIYSRIGVLTAGAVTIQRQGSYITNTAGTIVSETKYMGTSQGSCPAGSVYTYENCATYSCSAVTTLRVYISIDFGGGSNTASTANNVFTATRIA